MPVRCSPFDQFTHTQRLRHATAGAELAETADRGEQAVELCSVSWLLVRRCKLTDWARPPSCITLCTTWCTSPIRIEAAHGRLRLAAHDVFMRSAAM